MKYYRFISPAIFCSLCLAFSLFLNVSASSSSPGGVEDPIVTKSYVDSLISEISGISDNPGGLSEYEMEFIINEVSQRLQISQGEELTDIYSPVNLKEGQVIIGDEGTELILRSGKALAYSLSADGLANVTTGEDLLNNSQVSRNNLLIVPRNDGRGVKAESDIWVLVRGGYNIIN